MLISAIQWSVESKYICILFHILFHYGLSQGIDYTFVCSAVGPCCLFAKNWLIEKDPDAGKDWRQEEKGTTEDEMVDGITMSMAS